MRNKKARATVEHTFQTWYPTLLRYAERITGHTGLAEDAVQDVFVRLYGELAAGRMVNNPRAWTLVVLRRDLVRQWKTYQSTTSLEDIPEIATSTVSPDDDLSRLLDLLTPRESEVLLLRLEGMKYDDIARELDISANTVGILLVRSMRKLRTAVRPAGGAQPPFVRPARGEKIREPLQ